MSPFREHQIIKEVYIMNSHIKENCCTFEEAYIVKFTYRKEDGFWVQSHEEMVLVDVVHGVNEKNNHDKATRFIRKKYPGCKIISVVYV